jgi:hypothetical protein
VRTTMVGEIVAHRAHQREAVGDLGLPGEEFAKVYLKNIFNYLTNLKKSLSL